MKTVQNIKLLNTSDTTTPIQNIESGATVRFKLKNKNRLKIAKDWEDEVLRNDLLSIKNGNDLEIIYSDKTKVILEDFYSTDSSIELPAKDNGVLTISSSYNEADGLVYAYGDRDNLLEMSDSSLHSSINQHLDFSDLSHLAQSQEIATDGTNTSLSSSLSTSQVAGLSLLGIVAVSAMGSSGGGDNHTPIVKQEKGYFIDSAVGGVDYYINGVYAGKTGSDGSFNYREGTKIEFKVGNLSLGILDAEDIPADGKILPQDLVGLDRGNLDDERVTRIARVLQTLDSDGDATNGIRIDDDSLERLSGSGHINDLDFNALFDEGVDIVSKSEAQEHLLDTSSAFFSMDKQAPTATITLSDNALKVSETSIVTITFNEYRPPLKTSPLNQSKTTI